ncbi:DUF4440 domain-containing protein [Paraburkholderia bannensis]|uniref:DUF4440 domain-containing protein n=1 Tax=Paraburkholderia bannensis TaxID=765414 RepID=UPI002AB633B5|nr:DUF4440 domain-containing protein [Paraburkholderia bannensis]
MTANDPLEAVGVKDEVAGRIARMERLWAAGEATELALEFFSPHAILCGEGADNATIGAEAVLEALKAMLEATPKVTITLLRCTVLASDAAITWLRWDAIDAQGAQLPPMRSLTAWKKHEHWMIEADMYSFGDFDAESN